MLKNRYGELRSGWGLTVLLIGLLLAMLAMSQLRLALVHEASSFALLALFDMLPNALLTAVGLGGFWLLYQRPLRQMGLGRRHWLRKFLLGMVWGLAAMAAVYGLLCLFGQAAVTRFAPSYLLGKWFWAALGRCFFVAVSEEVLFRGFAMTALKTTRNPIVVMALPAAVFAALHWQEGGTALFYLNMLLSGALFGAMLVKTGFLWWPIGFHFGWNLGMSMVSNLPAELAGSYGLVYLSSGGSPEYSLVATLILALCLAVTLLLLPSRRSGDWSMEAWMPFVRGERGIY